MYGRFVVGIAGVSDEETEKRQRDISLQVRKETRVTSLHLNPYVFQLHGIVGTLSKRNVKALMSGTSSTV